jgi:anaerobic nitric oxide reductase transcription regulator
VDSYQKVLILQSLEANQGNWSATARQLKTDRANLNRLAQRLGIKCV